VHSVEVLIPNRCSFDGIKLTVESILKRTEYSDYRITVCDNSTAPNRFACEPHERKVLNDDDGTRLAYLWNLALDEKIKLIENKKQGKKYGHGENLRLLLEQCTADYAMLFNSTSEIIRGDWLSVLVDMIRDPEHDLGVARFKDGGNHFDNAWMVPRYQPNWMMLNMALYREFFPENNWDLEAFSLPKFPHQELFAGLPPLKHPEQNPPLVFADTGWKLTEKLMYDNPGGVRILPLPEGYYVRYAKWLGGIDRNSHRPDHVHVVNTLAEINERLKELRAE
jgi:hypothetical protein